MIEEAVGDDAAGGIDIFGRKEGFQPTPPFLVLAIDQDESAEQVLLLLVDVEVEQVWVACFIIVIRYLVVGQFVFLLLRVIIISHF